MLSQKKRKTEPEKDELEISRNHTAEETSGNEPLNWLELRSTIVPHTILPSTIVPGPRCQESNANDLRLEGGNQPRRVFGVNEFALAVKYSKLAR
ncbi:hypothetical protein M0R45_037732 [Rubus argutus]|uniref:Uncharacterized protein n=1 Tax=Rubus argutus TaxID=59490 RepID=A0AAW1W0D4_RUBAR